MTRAPAAATPTAAAIERPGRPGRNRGHEDTLRRTGGIDVNAVSRIAIVGHSDLVRNGLEHILAARPEFEVFVSGANGARIAEAVGAADGLGHAEPDGLPVILLGPHAEHEDAGRGAIGTEASISALSEFGRVLLIGDFLEANQLTGVIRAGAFGCVCGHVDEEELLLAIRTVARGGMHISPSLSPLLHSELRTPGNPQPAMLAPRETETLGWLALGLTHREIAGRMGLTEATVSTYVKRIRSKLNARNKAELTRVAIELGLLDLERPAMLG